MHITGLCSYVSLPVEINLDERFFWDLAKSTGKDWKRLGIKLGFKAAEIEAFEYNSRNNLEEQAFQMFVAWRRKQTNDNEARDRLAVALVQTERSDLAIEMLGKTKQQQHY